MTSIKSRFQRNLLSSAMVLAGCLGVSGALSASELQVNAVASGNIPFTPWIDQSCAGVNIGCIKPSQIDSLTPVGNATALTGSFLNDIASIKTTAISFSGEVSLENLDNSEIIRVGSGTNNWQVSSSEADFGLLDTGHTGDYLINGVKAVSMWDGDVTFSGVNTISGTAYKASVVQDLWGFNTANGITTVDYSGSGITLDSSASISYVMDANATLSTRDQYRFEGTAVIPASATLEAVLNDGHAVGQAYFSAKTFNIADGATIKVNGSSADYSQPDDTTRYVIVAADDTLNANLVQLNLLSEGLVDVEFDNSNNQIAVTVQGQDLVLLAGNLGDSANSQAAAGSLQSVLKATGGTATGDAYYELGKMLRESGSFEQLAPIVENTSSASIRNADGQTASQVGNLLQSYRGGASGDAPIASGLWIQGLSSSGEQDSMGSASGFEVDTSGYAIGYDIELSKGLTTGVSISYADSKIKVDNSMDRQDSDGYTAALYSQYQFDNNYGNAILSYGQNDNDSQRWVANGYANGSFDSDILSLRTEGGKKIWLNEVLVQPLIAFNYSDISVDGYTETDSIAALNVQDQDYKVIELGFGANISRDFAVGKTLLRPELKSAYYYDFQQDGVQITSSFTAGGNSFVTTGEDSDADRYNVKAGLAWIIGDRNTLRASYDFNSSDNYTGGTWLVDYRLDF